MQSVDAFWIAFMNRFGNPHAPEEQKTKLLNCRQGRLENIEEFNSRFLNLTLNVNFNDEALISIYLQAINPEILDKFFDHDNLPSSLEDTLFLCETIESRRRQVQNRRNLLANRFGAPVPQPALPTPTNRPAIGSSQATIPRPPASQPSELRGPLTDEEKQRRRTLGLCMYCGDNDHLVFNCPAKSKNPQGRH